MPLVLANRVQESGTANTTVSFTLTGAVTGFQSFSAIGNGNTTYYSATDASGNWEVGLGTYSTTGPTLTRTAVYASSNAGSAVTFSGTVNVFVTYPSGQGVNLDASGNVSALGTVTSGTWQGSTVGVAYGGTGVTASTGANSVVLRDANENITINRLNQGLQTTTASGGTTVLTAASDFNQALVGTGGQTYSLPDATTLSDTTAFQFNNNATGTLTITDYASATIGTIAPGGAAGVALLNNTTVGGTWDVHAYIPENVTWGTNALALGTTVITGGTWNGGTIQSGYGGTGLTTFASANNALYSTSASALAAGTLPVAAGGTGLTTYTLNGVVYASGTGTLATGSALTFDGTNLINTGAYTAPSNGAGAGTKTTIRGSTGTGQAGTSGGNGFIELIGGGGTSVWTAFNTMQLQRRRGGIYLQAGTAQADAGNTYVNGSTINIIGSPATNNGTATGVGSQILIQSGLATKTDGLTATGGSINAAGGSANGGGNINNTAGTFTTATSNSSGAFVTLGGGISTTGGQVNLSAGNFNVTLPSSYTNNGGSITLNGGTAASPGGVSITAANSGNLSSAGANIVLTTGVGLTNGKISFVVGNVGEAAQFTPEGLFCLGTTPNPWQGWGSAVIQLASNGAIVSNNGNTLWGANWYYASGYRYISGAIPASYIQQYNGAFYFKSAVAGNAGDIINFTQPMTLDASGSFLVGTLNPPDGVGNFGAGFINTSNSRRELYLATSTTSANNLARFHNPNGEVGAIQVSGTATSYVTSSDYRLKNAVLPMTNALEKVALLKPVTYKWKADGSDGEGFIAHELQTVVPQCVTGEKDAVDANGKPVYQGIDTSFLVATLTAAIQELKAEVDSLKAQLKGA